MKAQDVVLQLYDKIPSQTDLFNQFVSVSALSSTGTTATATSIGHGLITGDLVTITGAKTPVEIASITRVENVLTISTVQVHDLTEGYQETVELDGSNESEFNGIFELLDVPNRKTFTVLTSDSGATVATGSPVLLDGSAYVYNGLYQITVIDVDTFEYTLPVSLVSPAQGTNIRASVGYRITAAVSIERFLQAYTKNGDSEYWACVVLGNVSASKDRYIENDGISSQVGGMDWKQKIIQPFSIFVVAPATSSIAARPQRDEMEDLTPILFSAILGTAFDTGLNNSNQYLTVFNQHGFRDYTTSFYVHEFRFETTAEITSGDVNYEPFNVAFRNIELDMATNLMTDNTEHLTVSINLDDEPLP